MVNFFQKECLRPWCLYKTILFLLLPSATHNRHKSTLTPNWAFDWQGCGLCRHPPGSSLLIITTLISWETIRSNPTAPACAVHLHLLKKPRTPKPSSIPWIPTFGSFLPKYCDQVTVPPITHALVLSQILTSSSQKLPHSFLLHCPLPCPEAIRALSWWDTSYLLVEGVSYNPEWPFLITLPYVSWYVMFSAIPPLLLSQALTSYDCASFIYPTATICNTPVVILFQGPEMIFLTSWPLCFSTSLISMISHSYRFALMVAPKVLDWP